MGASTLAFVRQIANVRYSMLVWYMMEAPIHNQNPIDNLPRIGIWIWMWLNLDQAGMNMSWHETLF